MEIRGHNVKIQDLVGLITAIADALPWFMYFKTWNKKP